MEKDDISHTTTAAAVKTADDQKTSSNWLSRTSIYGFELWMATFSLTTAAIVMDYGLFAFFNYLRGTGSAAQYVGQASIWIVAAMLVWLPVAAIFYLRVRGEAAHHEERTRSSLYKFLVSLSMFVNILIGLGLVLTAVYSLLQLAVGAGDSALDVVVRLVIPAILGALIHGAVFAAFSRGFKVPRKWFAIGFVAVGILVMIGLLVTSVGSVRGSVSDNKREADLSVLKTAISKYYNDKKSLPSLLSDISVSNLKMSASDYTYTKDSSTRYQLCTTFATSTTYGTSYSYTTTSNDGYDTYPNFNSHDKGGVCFKVAVYSSVYSF